MFETDFTKCIALETTLSKSGNALAGRLASHDNQTTKDCYVTGSLNLRPTNLYFQNFEYFSFKKIYASFELEIVGYCLLFVFVIVNCTCARPFR